MPRFSDYPIAPSYADDDYLLIDGATNKTRRIGVNGIIDPDYKMRFEVIDNPDLAVKSDTIYYMGDYLIFVVVQNTASQNKNARQYRLSRTDASITYRLCDITNGVITYAHDWQDFYDQYRANLQKYVEVTSSDDAIQNGTIYKTSSNEICFISKGSSSARQYLFNFDTGSILTRTASVSNGNLNAFSNWVDIISSVANNKMGLITNDISVPYDYENGRPNTSSQVFLSISVGQVFISQFYDGTENVNTYWRKTSYSTCEPIIGKNANDTDDIYEKFEIIEDLDQAVKNDTIYCSNDGLTFIVIKETIGGVKFGIQYLFNTTPPSILYRGCRISSDDIMSYHGDWKALSNNKMDLVTNDISVPFDYENGMPNTASQVFASVSIGQIFISEYYDGSKTINTYWRKTSYSTCEPLAGKTDSYNKDEIDEIVYFLMGLLDQCYTKEEVNSLFDDPDLSDYRLTIDENDPPETSRANKNSSRPTLDTYWLWINANNKSIYKCTSATLTSSDDLFNYYNLTWSAFYSDKMDLIPNVSGTVDSLIPSSIRVGQVFSLGNDYYIRSSSAPQVGAQVKLAKYTDITTAIGEIESTLSQI